MRTDLVRLDAPAKIIPAPRELLDEVEP